MASILLEDSEVRAHVRAIHYSNLVEDYPETSREKLEGSLSFLLVELKIAVSRVAAQKTKRDILGSRLYAGPPGSGIEQFNHCVERLEAIANDLDEADSDRKEFFRHLRRCWVEKSMRAITKTPKDQWNTYIMILQQYTSPDELKSDAIFNSEL